MAYEVAYYFGRGDMAPEGVLASVVQWLRERGVDASLADLSRGMEWQEGFDWVASEVHVRGEPTGILVEIHGDDPITAAAWKDISDLPGAPSLPQVPGLCTLTLSGGVHEGVFEAVRTVLTQLWGACEFDEADGFTIR